MSEHTKESAAGCWLLGFIIAAVGVFLMLPQLDGRTLVGLALILWGNNLSQVRS